MGLHPKQAFLGLASHVRVFDFVQERFHNVSSGDFKDVLIKVGESITKEVLKIEKSNSRKHNQGCFASTETL